MEVVNVPRGVQINTELSSPNILSRPWGSAEGIKRKIGIVFATGILAASCSNGETQDPQVAVDGDINGSPSGAPQNPDTKNPSPQTEPTSDSTTQEQTRLGIESIEGGACDGIEVTEENGDLIFEPNKEVGEWIIVGLGGMAEAQGEDEYYNSHHEGPGPSVRVPEEFVDRIENRVTDGKMAFVLEVSSVEHDGAEAGSYEGFRGAYPEGVNCAVWNIWQDEQGEAKSVNVIPEREGLVRNDNGSFVFADYPEEEGGAPSTEESHDSNPDELQDTDKEDGPTSEPSFSEEDAAAYPFLPYLKELSSDSFKFVPKWQENGQLEVCIEIDAIEGSDQFYALDVEAVDAFYGKIEEIEENKGISLDDALLGSDIRTVAGDNC